jgi:hypothetical protein
LKLVDHLGFGARIESVSVLIDGLPARGVAFETHEGTTAHDPGRLPVQPGAHTLSIVVLASEPCGLFEQPRASFTVRAGTTFSVGEHPGTLVADLYSKEATSDPVRDLTVRFSGNRVVLGIPAGALDPPPGCDKDDALCVLDSRAALARSRNDAASASCFDGRRAEARLLQDTLDDSYAVVTREGATAGDAENAQLRARYARSRLRSLPAEAEACVVAGRPVATAGVVERKVERSCPTPDTTAGVDRF